MDRIDRIILNFIQEEFPLSFRPFTEIGNIAGITEQETLNRLKALKQNGYIRRIGPILERKKLKYVSTLCGVKAGEDTLPTLVNELNSHKGVTHNYERDGELNLWFTITAKNIDDIDNYLAGLEEKYSLKIYRFPEKQVFKIKTYFPV